MAKRYIIACAICADLIEVTRCDALTCSSRCRVHLHRHPDAVTQLRAAARSVQVDVFCILEAHAARALCPDLAERIADGGLTMEAARGDLLRAYRGRLMEAAQ
jgi:hypothetical protein